MRAKRLTATQQELRGLVRTLIRTALDERARGRGQDPFSAAGSFYTGSFYGFRSAAWIAAAPLREARR